MIGLTGLVGLWVRLLAAHQPQLPVVHIDTFGGDGKIIKGERILTSISVLTLDTTVVSKAELSIRGSSSSRFPKKPYRMELQDDNGDDLKISLLGMPKESDWILFPAYTDKTMIRDVLAYELWRQMGSWAPRTRYVELYLVSGQSSVSSNGVDLTQGNRGGSNVQLSTLNFQLSTNGYEGVYVLMEKIKRGKERVDIAKLTRGDNAEPKISGGYIFKKDRTNNPNDRVFRTVGGRRFIYEEPKGRDITPQQEHYLSNYVNHFEITLFSEHFADPERGYKKYIDIASFIDYHWIVEVSKNVDGYWFSVFFHKDRNAKLRAGPVWDYDLSFGNQLYEAGYKVDGWVWENMRRQYTWFRRMFDDPDFVQHYIDRWPQLRSTVFATSNVLALVDKFAAQIGSAAYDRNYARWPTLGKPVAGNAFAGKTWQEDIDHLKKWIKGRLEWIDTQDFPRPAMVVDEGSAEGGVRNAERTAEAGLTGGNPDGIGTGGENGAVFTEGSEGHKDLGNVQRSTFNAQPRTGRDGRSTIRMACLVGKIFYTTDGTDPRVSGGAVSEKALEYKEPIPVTSGLKLFARVRSDYGLWSAPVVWNEDLQKDTK